MSAQHNDGYTTPPPNGVGNILARSLSGGWPNTADQDLLSAAAKEFLPSKPKERIQFPNLKSVSNILGYMVSSNSNLCFGESHGDVAPIKLLMEQFKDLKKNGVTTLYMEHVKHDIYKADLDIFNQTGRMSKDLESFLVSQNKGHAGFGSINPEYNYLELYKAAQSEGIRICAIDTSLSYSIKSTDDRCWAFSYTASELIKMDQKENPGRWMCLVGSAHISTFNGVFGLADLFEDCISINVLDKKQREDPQGVEISTNCSIEIGGEQAYADLNIRGELNTDSYISFIGGSTSVQAPGAPSVPSTPKPNGRRPRDGSNEVTPREFKRGAFVPATPDPESKPGGLGGVDLDATPVIMPEARRVFGGGG